MEKTRFAVSAKKAETPKYSCKEWLSLALDVLAREGNAKLRVEAIAAALGVTTGSFYWHFKNRSDFLESLVRHWGMVTTDPVIEHVSGSPVMRNPGSMNCWTLYSARILPVMT